MSECVSAEIDSIHDDQNNGFIDRKAVDHCLLTWTIHNFQNVKTKTIFSPTFHISSESWVIMLTPLFMFSNQKVIKFHLIRNEVRNKPRIIEVTLRFGIKKCSTIWFEEKRKIAFPVGKEDVTACDILEYFDSENALKENTMTVQCEMYIAYSADESIQETHSGNALQLFLLSIDMLSQYEISRYCDVIIRGKNLKDILAHKVILSSRSPVFAKMLKNTSSSIDIPEDDCDHIHNILVFLYSGRIDWLIPSGICIGLYECAKRYEVTGLVQLLIPSEISVSSKIIEQRIDFTWKIDKFSSYNTEQNCCVTSPPFNSGLKDSLTWYLDIYPNGSHRALHNVGIFVRNVLLTPLATVNLSISILDEYKQEHIEKHTKNPLYPNLVYGFPYYTTEKELNEKGLLRGDKLIVHCKIAYDLILHSFDKTSLTSGSSFLKHPCLEELSADFERLLLDGNFSDLSLVADAEIFQVHKVILSVRSLRLEQLIKASGSRDNIICITDVSPKVLEAIIFYTYTGKMKNYNNHLIIDLYSGAKTYSMFSLVNLCAMALNSLDSSCVCEVILLASRHKDDKLLKKCFKYLKRNEEILESKHWKRMRRKDSKLSLVFEKYIKDHMNKKIKMQNEEENFS